MSKHGVAEEPVSAENPDAHLEQIRSILFGAQVQSLEQKLLNLEQRLQTGADQMNQALHERIAALESQLTRRLQQEAEERQIADNSLQGNLDAAVDHLEERLASQVKELRGDLKDLGKRLDQLGTHLQNAIDELRSNKADRKTLADLLASLADQLRKD